MGVPKQVFSFLAFGGILVWHGVDLVKAYVQASHPQVYLNWILPRKLKSVYHPFLEPFFPFYRKLNKQDQLVFRRRVQMFLNSKHFIPRGGLLEIDVETKLKISATATMLTFGYPTVFLAKFHTVLVYPDDYYSALTKKYHRGEVNGGGFIVLSKKALDYGFKHMGDGLNLAIHEMAHALRLENSIRNHEHGFITSQKLWNFDKLALREMRRMQMGEPSIFRAYAASNRHEFFAVSVEHYFEKGEEFDQVKPELYRALKTLLNHA